MILDDVTVERVLRTVECIPVGRVAAYGQVGAIAGVGPRSVGRILNQWGSGVPWWRVVRAGGDVAPQVRERAFAHWADEGIAVRADGRGCRMAVHGADLERLGREARAAWADLPEGETPPDH